MGYSWNEWQNEQCRQFIKSGLVNHGPINKQEMKSMADIRARVLLGRKGKCNNCTEQLPVNKVSNWNNYNVVHYEICFFNFSSVMNFRQCETLILIFRLSCPLKNSTDIFNDFVNGNLIYQPRFSLDSGCRHVKQRQVCWTPDLGLGNGILKVWNEFIPVFSLKRFYESSKIC